MKYIKSGNPDEILLVFLKINSCSHTLGVGWSVSKGPQIITSRMGGGSKHTDPHKVFAKTGVDGECVYYQWDDQTNS